MTGTHAATANYKTHGDILTFAPFHANEMLTPTENLSPFECIGPIADQEVVH